MVVPHCGTVVVYELSVVQFCGYGVWYDSVDMECGTVVEYNLSSPGIECGSRWYSGGV